MKLWAASSSRRRNGLDGSEAQHHDESRQGDTKPAESSPPGERETTDDVRWDRIAEILEAVNGRWAVHLLRHLASGVSRPADLLASVNSDASSTLGRTLSSKIMFEALRRLADLGLVTRVEIKGRRRETHYWLTSKGHGILAGIAKIGASDFGRYPLTAQEPAPPHLDVTTPSPARVWNYWIGA